MTCRPPPATATRSDAPPLQLQGMPPLVRDRLSEVQVLKGHGSFGNISSGLRCATFGLERDCLFK